MLVFNHDYIEINRCTGRLRPWRVVYILFFILLVKDLAASLYSAARYGHLDVVRHLCKDCHANPNQPKKVLSEHRGHGIHEQRDDKWFQMLLVKILSNAHWRCDWVPSLHLIRLFPIYILSYIFVICGWMTDNQGRNNTPFHRRAKWSWGGGAIPVHRLQRGSTSLRQGCVQGRFTVLYTF